LNKLFDGKSVGEIRVFENIRCIGCGESVNIKIEKTSEAKMKYQPMRVSSLRILQQSLGYLLSSPGLSEFWNLLPYLTDTARIWVRLWGPHPSLIQQ
jgi:hypothetical protein